MGNFVSGLSLKLLIGFVGLFLITACSGSQISETPQTQAESPTQVLQITPTLVLPPAADPATPTVVVVSLHQSPRMGNAHADR